ncbi:MAG: DMT family transporter [Acidimicrobiia bacterium]
MITVSARRHSLAGLPAVVAAVVFLSTGSTVVRKIGAPGITIACIRSLLATVVWQALLAAQGRHITWSSIRRIGPAGALFGINLAAFFAGVNHTSIANAEFIGTLAPILVLPAGALLFKESIPWKALPWGIGALAGVSLVLFNTPASGRSSWGGNVLVVIAVVLWACYLLAAKHARREGGVDVVAFMATSSLVAGLVLVPVVAAQGRLDDVPARGWPWLLLLTLVNGLAAHGLLVVAQRRVPVGTTSMLQVAQPALAVMWAYLFLDESIEPLQGVGMMVVVASLAVFTYAVSRSAPDAAAGPAGDDIGEVNAPAS